MKCSSVSPGPAGTVTPGIGTETVNSTTFSFPHDTWFDVKQVIDLDTNKATLFVDGNIVTSWDYVDNLGSIDFFSTDAALNRFWVDDVLYEQLPSCRPDAIICDNFEMYPVPGFTGLDGEAWWSTWSGAEGGPEDGILTTEQAYSGTTSMKIGNSGAQDVLLLLGEQSSGAYRLSWQMYIEPGHTAYYNIQNEATPGVTWNLDLYFNRDVAGAATPGTGVVSQSGTTFNVIEGQWFEMAMAFDLDNDLMSVFMDGQLLETTAYAGNNGSIDFFSVDANNTYYIDDVEYLALPTCAVDAIICDGLELYGPGTTIAGQAPWWSTWSGTAGGAEDGFVSNETGAHGANSLVVDGNGTTDVLLLLGNQTTGNYTLSWNQFVAAGHVAYYNIQNTETAGQQYNLNVHFGNDATGATAVFGQGVIAEGAVAFTYPEDTWFEVVHTFDLDNNTFDVWINGVQVITNAAYAGGLGAIDFYSINPDNLYFIDDVLFVENIAPLPDVPVTFQVDMTWEVEQGMTVSTGTVKLAGNFTTNGASVPDWDPTASPIFTSLGNDIYEVTINFPGTSTGQSLQYKFLNTATTWGDCGEEQECFGADSGDCTNGAPDYNRLLVIPDAATTFCYTYNTCLGCNLPNSTRDLVELPMTIAPNPFSSKAIVNFNAPVDGAEARLTTMTGQLVRTYKLSGSQLTIEKDALLPGMYFFTVVTEMGTSAAEKLIVQ
ncbi:MAG: T9SS type A sorting domain-containing protein [Saprospiraceae bacterium]|nr:T9SS type A sorting domain-containing protein [Saprospiraceae bacterium]